MIVLENEVTTDKTDFCTDAYPSNEYVTEDIREVVDDLFQENIQQNQGGGKIVFHLKGEAGGMSIPSVYSLICQSALKLAVQDFLIIEKSEEVRQYLLYKTRPVPDLQYNVQIGQFELQILTGDIVEIEADVIVNASNLELKLGAGISGAIAKNAGPSLQNEMSALAAKGELKPGDVAITGKHQLENCHYIFHVATVDGKVSSVDKAASKCLERCQSLGLKSIAFPALATGTGGLNMQSCAEIILGQIKKHQSKNIDSTLNTVKIVLWTKGDWDVFVIEAEKIWEL